MHSHIDFAYPWYLSYGHLLLASIGAAAALFIWKMKWSRILLGAVAVFTLWALSAAILIKTKLDLAGPMEMPAAHFLDSGVGKVLDLGAGTGRSSIMLLEARPKATLVALDLFTDSFAQHFGPGLNGQEKLLQNLKAAGVDDRATIQAGDMRKLPFPDAAFDGIISAYAIDHLSQNGIEQTFREAYRVLKPNGELLMAVIAKDRFLSYTFGPLLVHSRMRASTTWPDLMKEAGFEMVEQGTRPATLYYVARKHGPN